MIFAFDFDKTFTSDPKLFADLMRVIGQKGHTCIIVTSREDKGISGQEVRDAVEREFRLQEIPDYYQPEIVFAGAQWKKEAAETSGYKVDIWIDDDPTVIAKQYLLGASEVIVHNLREGATENKP